MSWQLVPGHPVTRWGSQVTAENAWQEYPRPQLARREWLNLNGLWEYAITSGDQVPMPVFSGQILVPFPLESALSGVKRALQPGDSLWYRRSFTVPEEWQGRRVLLHFGAVDWQAEAWLNGQWLGLHQGGYLPFDFEVTRALQPGENKLLVMAWDPSDTHWQARGKQVLQPKSIWYNAVSGIWQTVWLEPVPETYIRSLRITPDIDAESVRVELQLDGPVPSWQEVRLAVSAGEAPAAAGQVSAAQGVLELSLPQPRLWSPDSPFLYDLAVELVDGDQTIDRVESYFGMRKFSLGSDAQDRTRLCLNNQPLFQYGPLDQGYWPDGLYTPPSDEAMRYDLEFIKESGCNMLRKHVKVEPARYYYHCDRLGLIVWQDMMNGARQVGELPSLLAILFGSRRRDRPHYRYAGRQDLAGRVDFRRELGALVDHLYNFACIGLWTPFNEGWGQFDAAAIASWLKEYDPTRPVDHASGWYDQGAGDFKSLHVYFKRLPLVKPERARAVILSEFGGYSLKVAGHEWNPQAEFGYRKFAGPAELTQAYLDLLEQQLQPWIEAGLSAAVYTQTTDVETEINGYLTYDRQVVKMDMGRVKAAHQKLLAANA